MHTDREAVVFLLWSVGILLAGALASYLLFRPVAAAFRAGTLNNRVALLFFVHALGGAALLLGSYLLARAQKMPAALPLIAAAVGWTAPSVALALINYRRWQQDKRARKEERGDA